MGLATGEVSSPEREFGSPGQEAALLSSSELPPRRHFRELARRAALPVLGAVLLVGLVAVRPLQAPPPASREVSDVPGTAMQAVQSVDAGTLPTLFCWMAFMSGGDEQKLVEAIFHHWLSIFQCEEYAVYSDYSVKVGSYPDGNHCMSNATGDMTCKMASWGAKNAAVFSRIWEHVFKDARIYSTDYVVKVDPDTVFFPERLKRHLAFVPRGEPCFFRNWDGHVAMLGPLEVISQPALKLFKKHYKDKCQIHMEDAGEDGWISMCMGISGIKQRTDLALLDNGMRGFGNDRPCLGDTYAAYHPFKTEKLWLACKWETHQPISKIPWATNAQIKSKYSYLGHGGLPKINHLPSLFCWLAFMKGGHEEAIVKGLFHHWLSVFQCEDYSIYSDYRVEVGTYPDGSMCYSNATGNMTTKMASWGALNAPVFKRIWARVIEDGRFLNHDWVVKTDADCVFFPNRLKQHVWDVPKGEAVFFKNSWKGEVDMVGPLEVLSKNALITYRDKLSQCSPHLEGSGEDGWLSVCLGKSLGIKMRTDLRLLNNGMRGDPKFAERSCNGKDFAAYHPFKNLKVWLGCKWQTEQHGLWFEAQPE